MSAHIRLGCSCACTYFELINVSFGISKSFKLKEKVTFFFSNLYRGKRPYFDPMIAGRLSLAKWHGINLIKVQLISKELVGITKNEQKIKSTMTPALGLLVFVFGRIKDTKKSFRN